jgi:hypothetical protein
LTLDEIVYKVKKPDLHVRRVQPELVRLVFPWTIGARLVSGLGGSQPFYCGKVTRFCLSGLERNAMKKIQAPCSSCVRETAHDVLFETERRDEETLDTYALISCCGCAAVSMAHRKTFDGTVLYDEYYPSPVSRKSPDWLVLLGIGPPPNPKEFEISVLATEIYQAVAGGQYWLAAMGIRALLEQVMILKVGDLRTFEQKLDEFQKQGFVSFLQRDALRNTLEIGDAAVHRGFRPTEKELKVALDIVEGVLAPIFGHREEAERLADRVPPRKRPPPRSAK